MTDKEERELAAAAQIQELSGQYPDEISECEDGSFDFSLKISKTALDVFPYDDDEPYYCLVNTEINGDEKGWYEETMLYRRRPTDETDGYLIEGLYGRNIEYRDEPDAEFVGNYRRVDQAASWEEAFATVNRLHDERTTEKLLSFVENEIRILGQLTCRLGDTERGKALRSRYRTMMQDSLRRHMGAGR